jgi:hypothetical protein
MFFVSLWIRDHSAAPAPYSISGDDANAAAPMSISAAPGKIEGELRFDNGTRALHSMGAAERVLLPRLARAAPGTIVLANRFSCGGQIERGAHLPTQHLAEAILDRATLEAALATR